MNFSKTYKTLLSMYKPDTLREYGLHVVEWNHVAFIARGFKKTPIELQHGFIVEEFKELLEALENGDRIEVVDAACDLFVVSSYAYHLSVGSGLSYFSALKKQDNFNFNIGDLSFAIHGASISAKSLREILEQVVALCYSLDINLDYNMKQVLHSNDSKYPYAQDITALWPCEKSLSDALNEECKAIEDRSNGRYSDVYYCEVADETKTPASETRFVFFDGNGKIMKPSTFVEPKIIA